MTIRYLAKYIYNILFNSVVVVISVASKDKSREKNEKNSIYTDIYMIRKYLL